MARKNSPTRRARPKKDPPRRGGKLPPLFVAVSGRAPYGGQKYSAARLRDKGGYLYLQYRDGGKVRSIYVGRAKKSSPTDEIRTSPARAGKRRAKKRRG